MNDDDAVTQRSQSRFLATVLQSIGDAVIATDRLGAVSYLNLAAERLTQWTVAEAIGKPIEVVLRLVQEATGEPIENPVHDVIQSGDEGELPSPTLLIGRDGRETPIRDSIAPIRDDNNSVTGAVIVFRSVSELRASERRYQSMIEQVADHVVVMTDPNGVTTSWNRGVKDLLGYEEAEFIGHNLSELIFTDDAVEEGVPEWEFATSRETGSAIDDRWMKRKDGSHFWASGIMTVLRDQDENIIGYNKIMRDLTEQKTNLDAVRKLNYELTLSQRRKDDFIATLAHELRNPLAPVTTALTLMRECLDDPKRVGELRSIAETQVGQLVLLVEDLLDVSRIGQGKVKLNAVACKLQPLIAQAVDSSRPFIEKSSQRLTLKVTSDAIIIDAEAARIVQVITNVLNNAAKYSPEGGEIILSAEKLEGWAKITVSDDGVGIDGDELQAVFDLYAQVNPASERGKPGLGIGLALVKRIVDLHGGEITIQSAGASLGTTVEIKLKLTDSLAPPDPVSDIPPSDAAAATSQPALDVLVIDDTPALAFMIGQLIEKLGHRSRTAESGEDALPMIESRCPDVVVSDISMPGMNGYELASAIRSQYGNAILLIAMTGYSNDAARQRALEAGFDQHLVKPPDFRQLQMVFESCQDSRARVSGQQEPGKSNTQ